MISLIETLESNRREVVNAYENPDCCGCGNEYPRTELLGGFVYCSKCRLEFVREGACPGCGCKPCRGVCSPENRVNKPSKVSMPDQRDDRQPTANKIQYGGNHYKKLKIQHWDYVEANNIPYLEACAIKYLTRWRDKGGIEDLKKAIHFVQKRIELEEEKPNDTK